VSTRDDRSRRRATGMADDESARRRVMGCQIFNGIGNGVYVGASVMIPPAVGTAL